MFGEDDLTSTKPGVDTAAKGRYCYQMGDGTSSTGHTWAKSYKDIFGRPMLLCPLTMTQRSTVPADQRVDGEAFLVTDEPLGFREFARALGAAAGYPTQAEKVKVIPLWLCLAIVTLMEWVIWVSSMGKLDSPRVVAGIRYSMIDRTYNWEKAKKRINYKISVGMDESIKRAGGSLSKEKGLELVAELVMRLLVEKEDAEL